MASVIFTPSECAYLIQKYNTLDKHVNEKRKMLYDKTELIYNQYLLSFESKSKIHQFCYRKLSRCDITGYAYGFYVYSDHVSVYHDYSFLSLTSVSYEETFESKFFSEYNISTRITNSELLLCKYLRFFYYNQSEFKSLIRRINSVQNKDFTMNDKDIDIIAKIDKSFNCLLEYV